MKRLFAMITALLMLFTLLQGCASKNDVPNTQPPETAAPDPTAEAATEAPSAVPEITAAMAYEGVSTYCQIEYGWRPGGDTGLVTELSMGEETDSEHLVVYRSYTGAIVRFYVDKASGLTRVKEYVPMLDIEEDAGSFDLFDYLGREIPTPGPTAEPTEEPKGSFVFKPVVYSVFMEEVFGETMCETWTNLVNAVMAGEDTFACPDQHTYDWVMGQFPKRCFPPLEELIDYAYDRSNSVADGVASFTYLVPREEAAERISQFARQVEEILNEALRDDYTDVEKCLALYIYFGHHYSYDWETYYRLYEEPVNYTTTYRVFQTGIGICSEIAPAYSYLLMQAGVDATTMMGGDHEWSYVRINGRCYHIDPTFVLSDQDSLAYFMMDDAQREVNGYGPDHYTITSNYSTDHPHPDYIADDRFFEPAWLYAFDALRTDDKVIRCWWYSEGWEKEYLDFDYSEF